MTGVTDESTFTGEQLMASITSFGAVLCVYKCSWVGGGEMAGGGTGAAKENRSVGGYKVKKHVV